MYGGTKTEMERLIKDAEKLDKSFKAQRDSNGKLTLSFADVVNGIHIVQQNLGITGTSAEEAGTTIQGSLASVKAAWQDTLTAMGSGKDIDKKLDNFTRSVKKYGENMKPVIKQALSGAVKVIGQLAPEIATELPILVTELAPDLLKTGADIVTNLATSIAKSAPKLIETGAEIVGNLADSLYNAIVNSDFDKDAKKLTEKLNVAISKMDTSKSGKQFSEIVNKVITAAFNIVSTFDVKAVATKLTDWFNSALNELDTAKLGQTVSDAWTGVWDFIGTALERIDWNNVGEKISEFINNIDWWGILDSMFSAIGSIIKSAPKFLEGLIKNMDIENAAGLFAVLFAPKLITSLASEFASSQIVTGLGGIGTSIGTKIMAGVTSFIAGYKFGSWLYEKFKDEIDDAFEWFMDEFVGAESLSEKIKREAIDKAHTRGSNKITGGGSHYTVGASGGGHYNGGTSNGTSVVPYTPTTAERIAQAQRQAAYNADHQTYKANYGGMPSNIPTMAMGNSSMSTLNGAMSATNIYLDTGKLVGGTSRTSATQNNYAMRGYAT